MLVSYWLCCCVLFFECIRCVFGYFHQSFILFSLSQHCVVVTVFYRYLSLFVFTAFAADYYSFILSLSYLILSYKVAWAEAYLHTEWHHDPSSCLVTINMGRKIIFLERRPLFLGGGLGLHLTQSPLG